MNRLLALCALLLAPLLHACSGAQVINAITPDKGYSGHLDLPYGSHGQKLDVYQPQDAPANAPVVVFFYGGSWKQADTLPKASYKFVGQALAAQGYVTVIADYRTYPQVKYPDFLKDCAQAVRWAVDHAAQYGGDADKLILIGHSAGAYNAAMLALKPDLLRDAGVPRSRVRGMVGLAGPYDFLPIIDPDLQIAFGPRETWPLTQPIHYADGKAPPLLLFHGDADDTVWLKNTRNLAKAVQDHGGQVTTVVLEGAGHIRPAAQFSGWIPGHAAMMNAIAGFIARVTDAARS